MKVAGIICECNPFHAGHLRLMEAARDGGADAVICLMSGCFVQRGDAAVADPYARAEILVRSGADAVFEFPFPFCASGAEFFGAAGVNILSGMNVDELWFGSECGDLTWLQRMATVADEDVFVERYIAAQQGGGGTAKIYFECLGLAGNEKPPCGSNDILGISYLRALQKLESPMRPRILQRQGSDYRNTNLSDSVCPSATALRRAWDEKGLESLRPFLPPPCFDVLCREVRCAHAPASLQEAERAILWWLRTVPTQDLERCEGLHGGLSGRLKKAAKDAVSLEELLRMSATKKYTNARVRRGILNAMTGTTREDVCAGAAYVRLLAANSIGCAFLADCRKRARIPIVTRHGAIPAGVAAARQAELEERAASLYALCMPNVCKPQELYCRSSLIF